MTDRDLLSQALDALRQCEFTSPPAQRPIVKEAIVALRSALAAPMPEPVFWMVKGNCVGGAKDQGHVWSRPPTAEEMALWADAGIDIEIVPLYPAPPAAPAPGDMVMVPREPTIAMCIAGDSARHNVDDATRSPAIYRAMIAAAPPAAPAPVVPEGDVVVSWNEDGQIVAVTRQDREGRILSVIAESAAPVVREPLTDEQIEQAVTVAVKSGACPWMGYKKDENGEYTLPVLSGVHYGIARAIEQAHGIGGGK